MSAAPPLLVLALAMPLGYAVAELLHARWRWPVSPPSKQPPACGRAAARLGVWLDVLASKCLWLPIAGWMFLFLSHTLAFVAWAVVGRAGWPWWAALLTLDTLLAVLQVGLARSRSGDWRVISGVDLECLPLVKPDAYGDSALVKTSELAADARRVLAEWLVRAPAFSGMTVADLRTCLAGAGSMRGVAVEMAKSPALFAVMMAVPLRPQDSSCLLTCWRYLARVARRLSTPATPAEWKAVLGRGARQADALSPARAAWAKERLQHSVAPTSVGRRSARL